MGVSCWSVHKNGCCLESKFQSLYGLNHVKYDQVQQNVIEQTWENDYSRQ